MTDEIIHGIFKYDEDFFESLVKYIHGEDLSMLLVPFYHGLKKYNDEGHIIEYLAENNDRDFITKNRHLVFILLGWNKFTSISINDGINEHSINELRYRDSFKKIKLYLPKFNTNMIEFVFKYLKRNELDNCNNICINLCLFTLYIFPDGFDGLLCYTIKKMIRGYTK